MGPDASGGRPTVVDPGETWHLPDRVYVAVRPHRDSGGPMLELRLHGRFQQQVALAYSSLEQFTQGCGPDQPWMMIPSDRLPALAAAGGNREAFSVMLDAVVPDEVKGTAGGIAGEDAEWRDHASEDWDLVSIPSRLFQPDDEQALLELQPVQGDRLALMAYSSAGSLRVGCGPHQPRVDVPAGLLGEVRRRAGAHTICLDTPLPAHLHHGPDERSA